MDVVILYDTDDSIDTDENNDRVVIRIPKRYIRDGQDPFDLYSDVEFKKRYRFDKDNIKYRILPEIEEGLVKRNNRGLPISPILQLLICMRFYSTASFQLILTDTMSVSQPTLSRIIFRVSALLASLLNRYIIMPKTEKARIENQKLFRNLGCGDGTIGISNVDGAIDCTHIRILPTRFQAIDEIFRNNKGYYSLNVQTVVGPRMEFMDIVPEWPGSTHESRIFENSRIYMRYFERHLNGLLVGDSKYPCLSFLMTPLSKPVTHEQITYNNIQCRTREIVQMTYDVWRQRFPCLSRGLANKILCSTTIIVACAVLHNMAIKFNDTLPQDDEIYEDEEEELSVRPPHWQPIDGLVARDALIERMFN